MLVQIGGGISSFNLLPQRLFHLLLTHPKDCYEYDDAINMILFVWLW